MMGQNIVQLNSKKKKKEKEFSPIDNQWNKKINKISDFFLNEISVLFLDFKVLQTAKILMFLS
jgi:hypothetical protein